MTRRSWLALLALALMAPAALASAPRGASPTLPLDVREPALAPLEPAPATLVLEQALVGEEHPGFPLGLESLDAPRQRLAPLEGAQLLDEDLAAQLARTGDAEEPRYPETRIGGLRLFGQDLVVVSTPVSVDVRWGCADFGCGIAEGIGSWLSEDPAGTTDSPSLYAFVGNRPNLATDPLGLVSLSYDNPYAETVGDPANAPRALTFLDRGTGDRLRYCSENPGACGPREVPPKARGPLTSAEKYAADAIAYDRRLRESKQQLQLAMVNMVLALSGTRGIPPRSQSIRINLLKPSAAPTGAVRPPDFVPRSVPVPGLGAVAPQQVPPSSSPGPAPAVDEPLVANPYRPIGRVAPPEGLTPGSFAFGNEMHARIAEWLQTRFPKTEFVFRIQPGQTGVDVSYRGFGPNPGFNEAEIKPRTPSGMGTFLKQADRWRLSPDDTVAITYERSGEIFYGW